MSRRTAEFKHGRVVAVFEENIGDELDGDHGAGSTVLTLLDVSDFNDDGGRLVINNEEVHDYSSCDDTLETVYLDSATTSDWPEGTRVEAYPIAPVRTAQVLVHDEEDEDFSEARVPHHYVPLMPIGPRLAKVNQESVVLVHDGHEWAIFDILGKTAKLVSDHAPAERTFRYTAEGVGPDEYKGVKETGYDGVSIAARAHVDGAPTSDATLDLLLNGVSVATFTIAAGRNWSATETVVETFVTSDNWRVEFTDPQDIGANVVVYLYVTLNVDDTDLTP